jgi:PST family polysaccharide transporter
VSSPTTAGRSLIWALVESGGLSILALVMLLVVARSIGPTEFGTVALVISIVQILFILVDTLLHDAIVQRRYLSSKHLDTAFWVCSGAGVCLAVACWLGSGEMARIFDSPLMAPLLSVAGVSLACGGFGSVALAVLHREKKFKAIALRSLCARLMGAVVALALLVAGYGLWSLIGQHVVQVTLNAILAWPALTWRPKLRFSTACLGHLLSFGMFAVGSRVIWITSGRLFTMFIGYFIGVAAVGTLNIAQRVVDTLYELLSGAAYNLGLPYFSRHQHDRSALIRLYKMTVDFGALTTFPLFIGLVVCAPEIIEALLGQKWMEAAPLVRVLALAATFNFMLVFSQTVVMALGRPSMIFYASLGTFLFIMTVLVLLRPDNVLEAGSLWACRSLLVGPIMLVIVHRMLGVTGWEMTKVIAPPATAVLIMVGVLLVSHGLFAQANVIVELALTVALGAIVYISAICLLDGQSVRRFADFVLEGAARRRSPSQ